MRSKVSFSVRSWEVGKGPESVSRNLVLRCYHFWTLEIFVIRTVHAHGRFVVVWDDNNIPFWAIPFSVLLFTSLSLSLSSSSSSSSSSSLQIHTQSWPSKPSRELIASLAEQCEGCVSSYLACCPHDSTMLASATTITSRQRLACEPQSHTKKTHTAMLAYELVLLCSLRLFFSLFLVTAGRT